MNEAAWTTAGRLLLVTHLGELKLGCLTPAERRRDHHRLSAFGYDMTTCSCCVTDPPLSSYLLWEETPPDAT